MAKQALCVSSMQDIQDLVAGKVDKITTRLYDRDFCEDPTNNLLQVIPYFILYSVDEDNGRIHFLQYKRAAKGGDDRLLSKTSIGFGGHIDQNDELTYSDIEKKDGVNFYSMTLNNLLDTCASSTKRELTEELGVDILGEYKLDILGGNCFFFMGNQELEVNKVHVGLCVPVETDTETYNAILEQTNKTFNKDEIEDIGDLSVKLDMIVEEMNTTVSMNNLIKELFENNNFEDWSCSCLYYIIPATLNNILGNVTFQDLLSLARQKKAQESKEVSDATIVSETLA